MAKRWTETITVVCAGIMFVTASAQESSKIAITSSPEQKIIVGAPERFSGSVTVQSLFDAKDPSRTSGGQVTFQPGARSAWHTHPLGQTLIVTDGTGWIQEWGHPVQIMHKGDVIWIPPNVKHWHGASPTSSVTHIAIQEQVNGVAVVWLEKVSDEQYKLTK